MPNLWGCGHCVSCVEECVYDEEEVDLVIRIRIRIRIPGYAGNRILLDMSNFG